MAGTQRTKPSGPTTGTQQCTTTHAIFNTSNTRTVPETKLVGTPSPSFPDDIIRTEIIGP